MWTPTTRRQHSRAGLRVETDLTDAKWAVIASLMPEPAPCGRPPVWTTREVLNAIFYVLRGGIAWRLIPKDLPPRSTMFGYFRRWRDAGLFARINHDCGFRRKPATHSDAKPASVPI
jgi:transposase